MAEDINTAAILKLLERIRQRDQMPSTMQGYGINDVDGDLGAEVAAVGRKAAVTGASAVDPMSLSSAIVGRLSPQMRDDWRAYRASEPDADLVGQLLGGGGAYGGLFKAAAGTLPRMAGSAGMVTGSDVIDGDVGTHTLAKALASQVGIAPMRAFLPMAAGAVASQVEMVPEAQAQTKRKDAPAAPAVDYSKMEDAAKDDPVLAGLLDTIKAMDAKGASERYKSVRDDSRAASAKAREEFFRRLGEKTDSREAELKGKADAASQAVKDKAATPFDELKIPLPEWAGGGSIDAGRTYKNLIPFIPGIAGAAIGYKAGGSPVGKRFSTWREALDVADNPSAAPSARVEGMKAATDAKTAMDGVTVANTVAPRMAAGAGGGALAGAGTQSLPDMYDRRMLGTNPERDALVAAAEQYPEGHPERRRIEALLQNASRYPVEDPALTRAKDNLGDLNRLIAPALTGAMTGGVAAAGRAAQPFATNDAAMLRARTARMGQTTPKEVARESKRMDGIKDIDQSDAVLQRQRLLQSAIDDAALAQGQTAATQASRFASPELEAAIRPLIEAQARTQLGQTTQRALPPPNPPPSTAGVSSSPTSIDPDLIRQAVADALKKQGGASRSRPPSAKQIQKEADEAAARAQLEAEIAEKSKKFRNILGGTSSVIGGLAITPSLWDMITNTR